MDVTDIGLLHRPEPAIDCGRRAPGAEKSERSRRQVDYGPGDGDVHAHPQPTLLDREHRADAIEADRTLRPIAQ